MDTDMLTHYMGISGWVLFFIKMMALWVPGLTVLAPHSVPVVRTGSDKEKVLSHLLTGYTQLIPRVPITALSNRTSAWWKCPTSMLSSSHWTHGLQATSHRTKENVNYVIFMNLNLPSCCESWSVQVLPILISEAAPHLNWCCAHLHAGALPCTGPRSRGGKAATFNLLSQEAALFTFPSLI